MKVAVIGAGHMGRYHAEKLARCEGVQFAAVVDADRARAAKLGEELGCRAVADYKDIVHRADAAVIAVPTDRHHEVALACLRGGMHVFVEKPIARTVAEADELIAAAESRRLVLQVGHVERYNKAFRALAAQAEAFVSAVLQQQPTQIDGAEGRRALKLALDIGRLVRERLQRFA